MTGHLSTLSLRVLAGDDACCLVNKTHCRSLELRSDERVQLRHVRAEPEEPETNAGGDDHGANQPGRREREGYEWEMRGSNVVY